MYWPRVPRPPPPALKGAQQEVVGRDTEASRSRRLLTTSGLNLLEAESVLAENTFRRLRAKHTGGQLRSRKVDGEGAVGPDNAEPTSPGLSFQGPRVLADFPVSEGLLM